MITKLEVDGKTIKIKHPESIKVILDEDHPDVPDLERHVNITHEGVIVDIVNDMGEVVATRSIMHADLLDVD